MDYRFTAVAKHTGNPLGQTAEKLERLLLTHGQSPFLCLIGNGVIIMISQQIVNITSTKNKYCRAVRKFASSLRRYRTDLWPDKVAFTEKTAVPAA